MSDTNPIDQINADMEAAIAAQEAGFFSVASSKARSAWMRVGSLPDSELRDEQLRWKPEGIEAIVKQLQSLAKTEVTANTNTGGHGALFRPIEVEYRRG